MRHRRHTITVASSTLFFVCLMLHTQTGLHAQASTPYNDAHARKVYESLLPADWTLTAAHARRLHIALSPAAFNIVTTVAVILRSIPATSFPAKTPPTSWKTSTASGTACDGEAPPAHGLPDRVLRNANR